MAAPLTKPRASAHLQQAQRNYELYQQLRDEGRHLDWAVTLLFYTALHLIEAFLVETGTPFDAPRDHLARDTQMGLKLPELYAEYSLLYTRSQWARYHVHRPKPTPEQLQRYENEQFAPIVAELRARGVDLGV